ncbi:MFS transporter [Streptomyces kronopolitis]|uniref:MFS transporter n=1 Tax=Streptomyces kronopolitis TaxID=1612435 RepID=UPI003D991F65
MGSIAALLLSAAIVLGSRMLRDFDSALLPYAVATVFLAFGIAYRCTTRRSGPPAAHCLPRPLGAHSPAHRVARQLLLWGCLLAVLITVPLVWGWLTFAATTAPGPGYDMRIWGFRVIAFDSSDVLGWIVFRGLDLAALFVIAGAGYFLWRRRRERSAVPVGRVTYDFVALLALLVVSATGLLLTFSALFLHGGGYRLLSLLHMASVVFTLLYLPFGKFFPRVRRGRVIGGKPFAPAARQDE